MCSVLKKEFGPSYVLLNIEEPERCNLPPLCRYKMCSVIKKEFRLRNVSLNYEEPKCFTSSPWTRPVVFVIYRLILATYFSIATIILLANESLRVLHIRQGRESQCMGAEYLTSWNYFICLTHFIWATALTIFTFIKKRRCADQQNTTNNDNTNKTAWCCKLSWLLTNVVSSLTVIVTVVYFGFINNSQKGVTFYDWHLHGLPTIFVVVDNIISARPVRLLHVVYPLLLALIYLIFTVILWAADHDNVIYPEVLDWNDPGKSFGVAIAIGVGIVLAQILYFGLYRFQLFICEKTSRGRETGVLTNDVFDLDRPNNMTKPYNSQY